MTEEEEEEGFDRRTIVKTEKGTFDDYSLILSY